MSKKVMVAFDDSDNALRAVEYIAKLVAKDCRITLFSVLPDTAAICEMHGPELTPYFKAQQDSFCALEEKKKEILTAAQMKARKLLLTADSRRIRFSSNPGRKRKGSRGTLPPRPWRATTSSLWAGAGFRGSRNSSWAAFPRRCWPWHWMCRFFS